MELFLATVALLILGETTILLAKSAKKPLLRADSSRKIYVDTSALMDPRLLAVAQSGFISDDLIVPRSVTNELQLLADGKDPEKRARARAGLDTIRELERVVHFNLSILDDALDRTPVDNRLLELAKSNHGTILTNDFNLQKVAATEHVDILSLNILALALRNEFIPGERTRIKIISVGSIPHQGVGYLRDGTMVVVDNASNKLGKEVEVEFVRSSQTVSGQMMFAKIVASSRAQQPATRPSRDAAQQSAAHSLRKHRSAKRSA